MFKKLKEWMELIKMIFRVLREEDNTPDSTNALVDIPPNAILSPDDAPDFDTDDSALPLPPTKGLPIITVEENDENWTAYKSRRFIDKIYAYVEMPLSVSELSEESRIPFTYLDTDCEIIINKGSTILTDDSSVKHVIFRYPETYYRTEDEPERYPCECVCAVDDNHYNLFRTFKAVNEKADNIRVYSRLSAKQKEFIRHMASRAVAEDEEEEGAFVPIRELEPLVMMYEMCKNTYAPDVRIRAENIISQLKRAGGSEKADLINQLAFTIGIDTETHVRPKKSYDECMAIMDKHIYGLRAVKENVVEFIIAMQESGSPEFRLLLVGPPGVGKTSIVEAIAECIGETPVLQVDCFGVNFISIAGLVKTYSGAKAGKVMDGILELGQTDIIVMFEELDKMVTDKDGCPYGALIKPLGPQKKYYDEYVAADTDVSATKFIATANDKTKIPNYILSRFENNIFYIDAYTREEKLEIARKHVLPKALEQFRLSPEDCNISDEALLLIIDEYCSDEGVRELKGNLTVLMRKIISDKSRGLLSMPFVADEKYIKNRLVKSVDNTKPKLGFTA